MNPLKLKLSDIARTDSQVFDTLGGVRVKILVESDSDMDAPWDNSDGHGPVSGWRNSRDKRAGEWELCNDGRSYRFYDAQEAMKLAKRDGWGFSAEVMAELALKLKRVPTAGDIAAESVRRDFEFLRGWCNNSWEYLWVKVVLIDDAGEELAEDSLGGIESIGDYWRECARDMANALIDGHTREASERAYWESRDVETVGGAS